MRRFPIIGSLLMVPALTLLLLVGCTNPSKDGKKPEAGGKKPDNDTTVVKLTAATEGTIKGIVKFKGDKPEAKPEALMPKHDDKEKCLAGGKENPKHINEQGWIIGKNDGVENVVVWLAPPSGKEFDVTDKLKEPFKTKKAILDQPFCQYSPHMIAVFADVQELLIKNSSKVPHNVKITGGAKNKDTSDTMQPGTSLAERKFRFVSDPIPVACDMHKWMAAKIHTFDHPYFAVTGEDGTFEIANVPVGEELTVVMWHEVKGKVESKKTFVKGENKLELEISK